MHQCYNPYTYSMSEKFKAHKKHMTKTFQEEKFRSVRITTSGVLDSDQERQTTSEN